MQPFCGDVPEETLNHVQQRRGCWREVHVKARMLFQPCLYDRMFMCSVVAHDTMGERCASLTLVILEFTKRLV